MAAGQNSSGGPAGRGHHYKDRERLEEAQHAHALPGLLEMSEGCKYLIDFLPVRPADYAGKSPIIL